MGIDARMAWRNIWRNPRRTALTISAIAFASLLLVFMLSFQFGSYDAMINASVKIHTGHLQVQASGYRERQSMRLVVPDPPEMAAILDRTPGIDAYTFRANAFSLASSGTRTYGIMVSGIDPDREAGVSTIRSLIREGEWFSGNRSNQALVGRLLARNLQVSTGDELTILGQGRDGSVAASVVTVQGIYSSGIDAFDRSAIQVPLAFFQETYAMRGGVHEVVITADSLGDVSEIKKRIKNEINTSTPDSGLVVLDWMELMPGLLQGIQMDLVSGIIMYLILVIVVAFSILNTFLMAIFERTREFGVMTAIGTTPGRLTKLVLMESMMMTAIGIAAGIAAGCMLTLYFQRHGILISGAEDIMRQYGISGRMYPKLSLLSAVTGPVAVFIITLLAALYPALKIRRLRPVEAMTYI